MVGISFRRREQLKPDLVWAVLCKVIQSNARFGLTDRLEGHLEHVRIPVGNGIDVLSGIRKSIVAVKAAFLCLAHTLITAIALVNGDRKYALFRPGKCIKNLLKIY